jgi:PleD family two-component response regulator
VDQLSGQNILIFDTSTTAACNLRASLVAEGATVHVVSTAQCALMLLERKRIHAAFVASFPPVESHELCNRLRDLKIPQIHTGSYLSNGLAKSRQFALAS